MGGGGGSLNLKVEDSRTPPTNDDHRTVTGPEIGWKRKEYFRFPGT